MEEDRFSTAVVAQIAEVSLPSLSQLVHTGVITPSICSSPGRGSPRVFAFRDLVAVRFLGLCRPFALSPTSVGLMVRHLQTLPLSRTQEKRNEVIVGRSDGELRVAPPNEISGALSRSPVALVVDVDGLVEDVLVRLGNVALLRGGLFNPPPRGRPPKKKKEKKNDNEQELHDREEDFGDRNGTKSSKGGIK
jgi:hypothetical protein